MADKKHLWKPLGGCDSNPGVRDNGNGGLVYSDACVRCGLIRKRGVDYTDHRLENDWGPQYYLNGRTVRNLRCGDSLRAQKGFERNLGWDG